MVKDKKELLKLQYISAYKFLRMMKENSNLYSDHEIKMQQENVNKLGIKLSEYFDSKLTRTD